MYGIDTYRTTAVLMLSYLGLYAPVLYATYHVTNESQLNNANDKIHTE